MDICKHFDELSISPNRLRVLRATLRVIRLLSNLFFYAHGPLRSELEKAERLKKDLRLRFGSASAKLQHDQAEGPPGLRGAVQHRERNDAKSGLASLNFFLPDLATFVSIHFLKAYFWKIM